MEPKVGFFKVPLSHSETTSENEGETLTIHAWYKSIPYSILEPLFLRVSGWCCVFEYCEDM